MLFARYVNQHPVTQTAFETCHCCSFHICKTSMHMIVLITVTLKSKVAEHTPLGQSMKAYIQVMTKTAPWLHNKMCGYTYANQYSSSALQVLQCRTTVKMHCLTHREHVLEGNSPPCLEKHLTWKKLACCGKVMQHPCLHQIQPPTLEGVVLSFLNSSGKKLGSCCSLYSISTLFISITLCSAAKVWSSNTWEQISSSSTQAT